MSSNQKTRQNSNPGRQNNKPVRSKRARNHNGRKGAGRKSPQQPLTATKQVDSNGPAGKIRGNVKQLYDKYKALAHEHRTKDRTSSEAYGQYAHHYYTLYSEFAAAEAAQELERENEKARKLQEAAEDQSNIVTMLDGTEDEKDVFNIDEDGKGEDQADDAPKKVKRPTRKKVNVDIEPVLPLDEAVPDEKPKRERKQRKVKEEVAE